MNGPPESEQAGASGQSDAFVDRLGDRLSQRHQLPPEAAPARPASAETSDVHALPPGTGLLDDEIEEPPPPTEEDSSAAFADFEDLEEEATRIDDSNLLAEASTSILEVAPVQPFLAVEKGKDLGREFVLQEGENGVGRGIDNDVILADVAVSRRHLKISLKAGDLQLRDLGSGNGTLVNGEKVANATLVDGDRIELGETILIVRAPDAAPLDAPYEVPEEATDENHIASVAPPPIGAMTPSNPYSVPQGPGYQPERTPSSMEAPAVRVGRRGGSSWPSPCSSPPRRAAR